METTAKKKTEQKITNPQNTTKMKSNSKNSYPAKTTKSVLNRSWFTFLLALSMSFHGESHW